MARNLYISGIKKITLLQKVIVFSKDLVKFSIKNKIQHHILNWIVVSRYRMVHNGVPKNITLRYLTFLEKLLRKSNIIT